MKNVLFLYEVWGFTSIISFDHYYNPVGGVNRTDGKAELRRDQMSEARPHNQKRIKPATRSPLNPVWTDCPLCHRDVWLAFTLRALVTLQPNPIQSVYSFQGKHVPPASGSYVLLYQKLPTICFLFTWWRTCGLLHSSHLLKASPT